MSTNIFEKIIELEKEGKSSVLATVVNTSGSTPRKAGAKMLITLDKTYATIGGGEQEYQVVERAREMLNNGIAEGEILKFDIEEERGTGLCGGSVEIFVEPLNPLPKLYIFGAGHVGAVLAKMASFLEFSIVILDDRAELCNDELFQTPIKPIAGDFLEMINKLKFDGNTYVVIATRGHQYDYDVLKACIKKTSKYIGMMGSEKKTAAVFRKLKAEGFADTDIAKIYAPIGININNETPAEIAVSILAQIISIRRGT